jgi:subtilisin family serine protease/uncharacterized membrane protein
MKNTTTAFVSVAVLSLVLLSSPVAAEDAVVSQEVETEMASSEDAVEVLVTLEEPKGVATQSQRKSVVTDSQSALLDHAESTDGVRILQRFWITNAVLLEVEPGYDYTRLTQIGEVESLEPNTETEALGSVASPTRDTSTAAVPPTTTTEPTATSTPYGVEQINAPDVWSKHGTKGGGIKVAVLDTGVNASHPDIDLHTSNPSDPTYPGGWAEFDAQGNRVTGSTPYDSNGHGTHVSGTVAGEQTGVAPDADLMHGLILNGNTGTLSQALSGVEWAMENDADVVSMSIGGGTQGVWADVAKNANDMGVLLVSSVGNNGAGTSASPGNVYDAVGVGAVDQNLNVAGFSGGEVIDTDSEWGVSALDHWPNEYVVPNVVSAGVGVKSTSAGGGYESLSGTSMAAPHVAGAAALSLSASGSQSPEDLREAFSLTAFGSGSVEPDTRYGQGAADALAVTDHLLDDASVSGTVVDGSGATVTEAEVHVNGVRVDDTDGSYDVALAGGTWNIDVSAPGYEDVAETVSLSQGETVENDIVLGDTSPASFDVGGLNGPSSAETSGGMTVSATVTNTGDVSGTQDVTLRLAETGNPLDNTATKAQEEISLASGASRNVGFTVGTPSSEGSYTYGVFTENDSSTSTLNVEDTEAASFAVDGELPNTAEAGERMNVSVTVTNTGGASGTKEVSYRRNERGGSLDMGATVESRDISVGASQSETVEFDVPAPGTEGVYVQGVFTGDDSVTGELMVQDTAPAFFDVSGFEAPETAEAGEDIRVNTTIANLGDASGTQDVTYRLNRTDEPLDSGSVVETETVDLGGGVSKSVEFIVSVPTEEGGYRHGFFSEDDDEKATLTVESGADGGTLSDGNPFGDVNNEPLAVADAADVLFDWNRNDASVDGTKIPVPEMADHLFEWNKARR